MTSRALGRRSLLGGAASLALAAAARAAEPDGPADRILLGRIATFDAADRIVDGLAIRDGLVVAAGSREEVLARRGSRTLVHDLGGDATVIPGFNDAHAHLNREGLKGLRPSLAGIRTIAALLARIERLAAAAAPGVWIVTMPLGEPPYYFEGPAVLAEGRMPTRAELDGAAPDNPVYIAAPFGFWGEPPTFGALNSRGLRENGIDRTTAPRISGIEVVRGPDGEPTGVLVNRTRTPGLEFELLPAVPRFAFADRLEGLRRSLPLYHARGTTSVYEGHGESPESIAVFRALWERGELTMRCGLVVSPSWADLAEAERAMRDWLSAARGRGVGDPMLRISGIYVQFGGSPQVAALSRARLPDTGWSGQIETATTPAEFEEICRLAVRYDLRLNAIASDGIKPVLAILKRVADKTPIAGRRWVVQHIGPASPDDLATLRALGVGVTLIPVNFLYKGGARYADLPAEAAALLSPAKQLLAAGIPVAAGTDNIPYDPLFTVWSMMARTERRTGRVIGPESRLTAQDAIRLMTVAGAWLTFEEDVKGPLLPGRYADLAVLPGNPFAAEPEAVRAMAPIATMVGGRLVHGALPG